MSLKSAALLEVVLGVKDSLLSLSGMSVPPKEESIKALAAVMLAVGMEKGAYTDLLTGKVMWPILSPLITEDLLAKMDCDALSPEAGEALKAALEGVDPASVPWGHIVATSSVAGLLAEWVGAVAEKAEAKAAYDAKLEEMKAQQEAEAEGGGD